MQLSYFKFSFVAKIKVANSYFNTLEYCQLEYSTRAQKYAYRKISLIKVIIYWNIDSLIRSNDI